jgi:mannose-6-phosphate isomerase-like protein (cupin superfamily)
MKRTVKINEGYIPTTKDKKPVQLQTGVLRRLVHPDTVQSKNVAVSILTMNPGDEVAAHYHKQREEVYFILSGEGIALHIEEGKKETIKYEKDLSIHIPVGTIHDIKAVGNEPLRILVIMAPPLPIDDAHLA